MKRALCVGIGLLFWAAFMYASEPNGLGDLRWGDPAPKGWQRNQGGGNLIHTVRGRGSAFGAVPVERVDYEFTGGVLVRVVLLFKGRPAFSNLQGELEASFQKPGEFTPSNPASETLCWQGQTTCAYLNFVKEGIPGLLVLCRAPEAATPEALAVAHRELSLLNRLRLYEHLDAILEKNIKVISSEIGWVDRAIEGGPQDRRCQDLVIDRDQQRDQQRDQRTRQDWVTEQNATVAERARLGADADKVRAELASLRKS